MANTEQEEDPPILTSEVEEAIRNMKDGKSPGIDNIPTEMLKTVGKQQSRLIHKTLQWGVDIKNLAILMDTVDHHSSPKEGQP